MRRHRSVCPSALLVPFALLILLAAGSARALCPNGGGANQTSEPMAATRSPLANPPSPGSVSAALVADDLLISEVKGTETRREFIEIYNPTSKVISLDEYYLTDYASEDGIGTRHGYWEVVTAGFQVDNVADFVVKFPLGASLAPGQALVVATGASVNTPPGPFLQGHADYEILDVSSVANMQLVGGTPNGSLQEGLLFDNAEFVMLFKWDGGCDLVCDVDYFAWGAQANGNCRVDKTGIVLDGPDADQAPGAYLADITATQQERTAAASTSSDVRISVGLQQAGGNGCVNDAVPVKVVTWGGLKALYRGSR